MLTVKNAIKKALILFESKKIESLHLELEMFLCEILDVERLQIIIGGDRELSQEEEKIFFDMVSKRLSGIPVQYIIKSQEFMGLNFYVDERVLIPRSDTEILVEYIVEHFKNKKISFIDIGCGSGAISISLLKYLENSICKTIDISEGALDVAKINARNNDVLDRIEFINSNLLRSLNEKEKVDLIVSNPPYIPSDDIDDLQIEVKKYEPSNALDGGKDGLDFYREIIENAYKFLNKEGMLAFEVGYNQAEDVKKLMNISGEYRDIIFIKDLQNFNRCVIAKKI